MRLNFGGIACKLHGFTGAGTRIAPISAKGNDGHPAVIALGPQQLSGHIQQLGLHVVEPGVLILHVAQLGHGSGQIGHKDVVHLLFSGVVGIHLHLSRTIDRVDPAGLLHNLGAIFIGVPVVASSRPAVSPAHVGDQLRNAGDAVQLESAAQDGFHTLHHIGIISVETHLGDIFNSKSGEFWTGVEGKTVNPAHISQTVNTGQVKTFLKRINCDGVYLTHFDIAHIGTTKRKLTNRLHMIHFDSAHISTIKCILTNGFDTVHGQPGILIESLLESLLANAADVIHGHIGQPGAREERQRVDTLHILKTDVCQTSERIKCTLSNTAYICNPEGSQRRAGLKRKGSNALHTINADYAFLPADGFQSYAVAERLLANGFQGLRQHNGFQGATQHKLFFSNAGHPF